LRTLSAPQTPRPESEKLIKLKIIQQQAGHAVASTTAIYTSVSDEFRNRLLEQAIGKQRQAWRTL
jgi:integrase